MNLDPSYIAMGGQIVAYVGSIAVAIWKISAKFARYEEIIRNMTKTLATVAKSQGVILKDLNGIEIKMQSREKEINKLDACIDGTRKDIYELIKETQKNQSKVDALWITLQNIFPDQVPRRAADRKNV